MLDRLFYLADGTPGTLTMIGGSSVAAFTALLSHAAPNLPGLMAQAAPALEGVPGYLNVAGIAGGLIIAVSPLVLRVVDLQRQKQEIRRKDQLLRQKDQRIQELIAAIDARDADNRRLREFSVRSSLAHKYELPKWFYVEPTPPRTGDHPLILTPDPDAEPDDR